MRYSDSDVLKLLKKLGYNVVGWEDCESKKKYNHPLPLSMGTSFNKNVDVFVLEDGKVVKKELFVNDFRFAKREEYEKNPRTIKLGNANVLWLSMLAVKNAKVDPEYAFDCIAKLDRNIYSKVYSSRCGTVTEKKSLLKSVQRVKSLYDWSEKETQHMFGVTRNSIFEDAGCLDEYHGITAILNAIKKAYSENSEKIVYYTKKIVEQEDLYNKLSLNPQATIKKDGSFKEQVRQVFELQKLSTCKKKMVFLNGSIDKSKTYLWKVKRGFDCLKLKSFTSENIGAIMVADTDEIND